MASQFFCQLPTTILCHNPSFYINMIQKVFLSCLNSLLLWHHGVSLWGNPWASSIVTAIACVVKGRSDKVMCRCTLLDGNKSLYVAARPLDDGKAIIQIQNVSRCLHHHQKAMSWKIYCRHACTIKNANIRALRESKAEERGKIHDSMTLHQSCRATGRNLNVLVKPHRANDIHRLCAVGSTHRNFASESGH